MKKMVVVSIILAIGLCLALFLVEMGLGKYFVPAATMRDMIIQQTAPVQENPQDSIAHSDETRLSNANMAIRSWREKESPKTPSSLKQKK